MSKDYLEKVKLTRQDYFNAIPKLTAKEIIDIVETEFARYIYQKNVTLEDLKANLVKELTAGIK
jgi:hypothetical protein